MNREENIILGLSVGDLNGIGLELIISIFEDKRMLDFCTPVVFGSLKTVNFVKKHLKSNIGVHAIKDINGVTKGKFNVLGSYKDDFEIKFGEENPRIGEVAIESFTKATKALKEGAIDVLVTAPINKHNITFPVAIVSEFKK